MNAKLKVGIKKVVIALVVTYLLGGVVLYFVQDQILFHPKRFSKEHRFVFEQAFEEINVRFEENNVSIVRFRPHGHRKGIVLFYHGNVENVEHYKKYPPVFLRNNYELWMIDYPGFGKTTGRRTEKIINEQATMMYDMAAKETGADSIIIYGKSIGTGVASFMASNKKCRQLILETPYYSIPSLARHYFPIYPVNAMIRFSFPVHDYLKDLKLPVLIFHGTKDEVVPYIHSRRLKEENEKIELVTIKNGRHNNLSEYPVFQKKIDSVLTK